MTGRSPYELLTPVRALRKELGLTPNDLAVLAGLISFLPRDGQEKIPRAKDALTIVFASNAALAERANGLDERTIRRCISRLSAAGLVARRNSANGKRFPLRYCGIIRDAFGFDLAPLIERQDELAAQAAQVAQERERLRSLRAEALALRAAALLQPDLGQTDLSLLDSIRTVLRRSTLTIDGVLALIGDLRKLASGHPAGFGERSSTQVMSTHTNPRESAETPELTARNGQNVRHIESTQIEFNKTGTTKPQQTPAAPLNRDPATMSWDEFRHVAGFYPTPPRDAESLTRMLLDLGRMLRIGQDRLLRGLRHSGPGRMLLTLDYLIARADAIRNPAAYFDTMLEA